MQRLATALFPREKLDGVGDCDLSDTSPPDNELHIGCFPGVSVIAAKEFGIDYPSMLPQKFIAAGGPGTVTLHAMHSVIDWFALAQWTNGKLLRSLSLSPDSGIPFPQHSNFPQLRSFSSAHPDRRPCSN